MHPNWFGLQGPDGEVRWRTQLCDWGSQYLSMPQRLGSWLAETVLTALTERRAVMASNVMIESFFIILLAGKGSFPKLSCGPLAAGSAAHENLHLDDGLDSGMAITLGGARV